jgi:hypothetical protein
MKGRKTNCGTDEPAQVERENVTFILYMFKVRAPKPGTSEVRKSLKWAGAQV